MAYVTGAINEENITNKDAKKEKIYLSMGHDVQNHP